jgi:succinate-semialdehyde dehydrogenase / glutarate-semialdehyde dehydrogenase
VSDDWHAIETINPATGDVLAGYPEHTADEVAGRIEQAHHSYLDWSRLDYQERAPFLLRMADLLEERCDELATLMALEMGKPVREGRSEANKCAWVCRHYAENAAGYLEDFPIVTERSASYVAYRPLGVVLAVMPWNFPLWQVFRFSAPALMAGNGVLLKHASNVTGCALAIERIVQDAGLPAGLFGVLVIGSSRVASVLDDPRVVAATLTGSGPAGAAVAAKAGSLLKKTVLELGGSDPYLVLADADLDLAAEVCAASRLINGGQSCIAAKRFIVASSVHDEFVSKLASAMANRKMGDPLAEDTDIGPQARLDLRDELSRQVLASVSAGAKVVLGGEIPAGPGAFYPPTVLAGVTSAMPVYSEETFGPVAAVIAARDEEAAIAIANSTEYGLGAAVFTSDAARGERIAADRLEAGACFVNAPVASDPRLPFGGIKRSGFGRELAGEGIREFVNVKTVVVA